MYETYYGLRERPFDLSPNPRFLFLSKGHRAALTHLKYGLSGRPGLSVLIGDAGTGKTTLVMSALGAFNGSKQVVHLSNPTLSRSEFVEYLAAGFGFPSGAAKSKTQFLRELEHAISERAEKKEVLALVVDEAQSLPFELLEEIRLLTNVETKEGVSLAVALVGQPELGDRLNDSKLRQIKQRVALRCQLAPLEVNETAAYIAARVRVAGGNAELLFTRDAVRAIHEHAQGIPRTISVICDNALVGGFATDVRPIGRDLILEVCRDFEIGAPSTMQDQPIAEKTRVSHRQKVTEEASASPEPQSVNERGHREPMFSGFVGARKRFSFLR